jgi:hypothetical protein
MKFFKDHKLFNYSFSKRINQFLLIKVIHLNPNLPNLFTNHLSLPNNIF